MAWLVFFIVAVVATSVSPLAIRSQTCAVCPQNVTAVDNTTYYLMAASGNAPGTPEFCGYTQNTTANDMDFFCQYGNGGNLTSCSDSDLATASCPNVTTVRTCTYPRNA
ncbi:hypothetical protein NEOLEDRAFT_1129520 [Neolentinus lepideus HHB14362 ss-1]|uniref:Uncharacterized protein n=1 Tax=Neolentinus lepideus HHB14362 ss-1 TaxID=1314782 RepID=A0A165UI92_9AGAM|nr:hypothetical protein NEOLEDRAFT_1129520 [Neolentinus lepideus HHB14362 ss-1]